jgi:hypothetical protein
MVDVWMGGLGSHQAVMGVDRRLTRTATKNAIADSIEASKTVHSTAT